MQSSQVARAPGKEEEDEEVEEKTAQLLREKHQLPLSAQSAFAYVPPGRRDPPELSYFHREAKVRLERERGKQWSEGESEGAALMRYETEKLQKKKIKKKRQRHRSKKRGGGCRREQARQS